MNSPLMLMISILVYLILSTMVMDLFMELIAHVLQAKTGPDPEENTNEPRPITPQQDERRLKTLAEHAPDTRQDDSPCLPPASGPGFNPGIRLAISTFRLCSRRDRSHPFPTSGDPACPVRAIPLSDYPTVLYEKNMNT
ncbi:hypothetical protein [Azorhizophilus paspali]|uniref:Uncharacterized protein n=1 Tax=Azorhizophilus paspali TaxID=69963 RepID=A0ABV6SL21_AZOPA